MKKNRNNFIENPDNVERNCKIGIAVMAILALAVILKVVYGV